MSKIIGKVKRRIKAVRNIGYSMLLPKENPPQYEWDEKWEQFLRALEPFRNASYRIIPCRISDGECNYKWVGGVTFKDRVYGLASGSSECLVINPETKEIQKTGDLTEDSFKWSGGCVWNGKIYGFPRKSNRLLVIEPGEEARVYTVPLGIAYAGEHHYGGALAENGCVYQPPRNTDHLLKIDLNSMKAERIRIPGKSYKHRYCGSICHPNGLIYFFPEYMEKVMVLDPKTERVFFIGKPVSTMVFGAIIGTDGNIYGFSAYGKGLMCINVRTNTVTMRYKNRKFGCYGTELGMDGRIYGIPGEGDEFYRFDPENEKLDSIGRTEETGTAKCAGATVSTDGKITAIPAFGNYIYFLEPDCKADLENTKWLNNCY